MANFRRPFVFSNHHLAIWIIALNVLVFALIYIAPGSGIYLALSPRMIQQGSVWQFFTYMFVHSNFFHLLFNMIGVFFFGRAVEQHLGSKEFALYYFLTGTLSGVLSFVVYLIFGAMNVYLLGASGAVFALLLAFAALEPDSKILVWGILPVRAPILVIVFAGLEVFYEVSGFNQGIAHITHLSGIGFGWLYFLLRFGVNPGRRFFPRR